MACKIDLRNLIVSEATSQGVDPAITLSVAQRESGTCHWAMDGSVVRGKAGEVGLFQLMPKTAAGLGVDPFDVNQNIQGGIKYLKQMITKYGDWNSALAAWNWGPGNVDKALAAGTSFPDQVVNYIKGVLGIGKVYSAGLNKIAATNPSAPIASSIPSATSSDLLVNVTPSESSSSGKNPMLIVGLVLGGLFVVGFFFSGD